MKIVGCWLSNSMVLLWYGYEMKVWNQSPNQSGWKGPWGDMGSNLEHMAQHCIQVLLECPQ